MATFSYLTSLLTINVKETELVTVKATENENLRVTVMLNGLGTVDKLPPYVITQKKTHQWV